MVAKLFIDSDVVIDLFTDREPFVNAASEIFDLNERGKIKLYLSAISINNIYYIVRRYLGHENTIKIIEDLTEMTQIVATTQVEIVQALKNNFSDYEDSIQYSTALRIEGIEAIITRNTNDYKNSKIPVFTPTDYLKISNGA